jgi:ketosteroid isomerase-like protein
MEERPMLNEAELLAALRRHWDNAGIDEDATHEIYHDDAVLEFPQSGERFEGVENFKEWRRRYPAALKFHIRRITHREDLVVVENLISYDGSPWQFTVNLLEFRGERVAHERIYIMDGWEAAEWRAPWRADTASDPPYPDP